MLFRCILPNQCIRNEVIFAPVNNARIPRILEFLEASPDDLFLTHALALEWIKEGDDAQAEALFRKNQMRDAGYVATYYHLGKLLERQGRAEEAIQTYEQGIAVAQAAGDSHSRNELQGALDEILE